MLVAGGQTASNALDPREPASTRSPPSSGPPRSGDTPTGSIEYKTIFAVGHAAVRPHADHEPDLDPLRAEVPAGVRMSAHGRAIGQAPTSQRAKDASFRLAMCRLPRRVGPAAGPSCSTTWWPTARPPRLGLHLQLQLDQRREVGRQVGDLGHGLADGRVRRVHRAGGRGHRHLPRGVRGQHALVEPADRDEHPEPRRGPLGGLRDPRPGVPRSRAALARPGGARRRAHPRAARASGGDHRCARGDQGRAALDPGGLAGAGSDAVADDPAAGAAGLDPGHRNGRDPRAVARDRRDGAADRGRRRHGGRLQPRRASTRASPRCRSRSSTGSPAPRTTSTTTSHSRRPRS